MWIPSKASNLLVGLGLLLIIISAVSGLADARQTASPFEQEDKQTLAGEGFDPIIVPDAGFVELWDAPTLLPQVSATPTWLPQAVDMKEDLHSLSPPDGLPTSPPIKWQDEAVEKNLRPTATPVPTWIPDRIYIPAIKLYAPVVPAILKEVEYQGKHYQQLVAPNAFAVGQFAQSAPLGAAGNTVLIGHHNYSGEVFGHLVDLQMGDLILMYSGDKEFAYEITRKMFLLERNQPVEVRLKNAQWVAPSQDERLTLVTCWPYNNNTHRLVIVAMPVNLSPTDDYELTLRLTPHPP